MFTIDAFLLKSTLIKFIIVTELKFPFTILVPKSIK